MLFEGVRGSIQLPVSILSAAVTVIKRDDINGTNAEFSDKVYWQVADRPGKEGPDLSSRATRRYEEEKWLSSSKDGGWRNTGMAGIMVPGANREETETDLVRDIEGKLMCLHGLIAIHHITLTQQTESMAGPENNVKLRLQSYHVSQFCWVHNNRQDWDEPSH